MKKIMLLTAVLVLGSLAAQAGTTMLTFEGLQNLEPVLNYYDGALGGNGSGPGPNYGTTFGPNSFALVSDAAGGSGNFDGAPTMPTVLFFLSGTGDMMNVPAGFTTGFSTYYSSPFSTGSATIYSGLNGTGTALATLTLPSTPDGTSFGVPCSGAYDYCPFLPAGVSFSGTAYSVDFSAANNIAFDNVTFTPTPEPGTLVMFASGALALAGLLRRKFLA